MKYPYSYATQSMTQFSHALKCVSWILALPRVYDCSTSGEDPRVTKCYTNPQIASLSTLVVDDEIGEYTVEEVDNQKLLTAIRCHVNLMMITTGLTGFDIYGKDRSDQEASLVWNLLNGLDPFALRKLVLDYFQRITPPGQSNDTLNNVMKGIDYVMDAARKNAVSLVKDDVQKLVKDIWMQDLSIHQAQALIEKTWDGRLQDELKIAYGSKEEYIRYVYETIHAGPPDSAKQ